MACTPCGQRAAAARTPDPATTGAPAPLVTQGLAVSRFGFPAFAAPTWLLILLAALALWLLSRRRG